MRSFGTQGRVRPEQHYIVPRTAYVADFITRIRAGKYIVLFAPRQTGKTTFFRLALDTLLTEAPNFFPILEVPNTPQEYVGQYLLYAYLDHFVRSVGANMFLEVQTGHGRIDLLILRAQRKYIVETKIWEGSRYYQAGKMQLAAHLKLEEAQEGYYVVFDHRQHPESRVETETIAGVKIRSYVIPVMQERPSAV